VASQNTDPHYETLFSPLILLALGFAYWTMQWIMKERKPHIKEDELRYTKFVWTSAAAGSWISPFCCLFTAEICSIIV
jgi:hypothetical protein